MRVLPTCGTCVLTRLPRCAGRPDGPEGWATDGALAKRMTYAKRSALRTTRSRPPQNDQRYPNPDPTRPPTPPINKDEAKYTPRCSSPPHGGGLRILHSQVLGDPRRSKALTVGGPNGPRAPVAPQRLAAPTEWYGWRHDVTRLHPRPGET